MWPGTGSRAARVDPEVLRIVKAASVVERNGVDYAAYLKNVFTDDPAFQAASDNWAVEEVQHGDALGHWAMLADGAWDYPAAFERYRASYQIPIEVDASVRGSRTGELIARCMVETGTSSFYTALADATDEPVLKLICKQIAADEYRHFKLFYDHMHRYLRRERLGVLSRARIALGRGHRERGRRARLRLPLHQRPREGVAYDHQRCIAAYMTRAMGCYRRHHIDRAMGMMFKTIGASPRAAGSRGAPRAWRLPPCAAAAPASPASPPGP